MRFAVKMMSERKRKQKWSLNPRGKSWSDDPNSFGQKLLQKMGWSAGKGLGANEDGMTDHIRVAYKNDTKGMGFKIKDDQWSEHESNFTELLNSLGGAKNESMNDSKIESLEKKSQTSKARVHYHKFTRGKDLSRYSEKDLANIFGKKSLTDLLKPQTKTEEENNEKENVETKSFGVVTHNGGNMLDYFKNKLGNLKNISSDSVLKSTNNEYDVDIGKPSFGLGFSGSGNLKEENQEFVSEQNGEKPMHKKNDQVDNFRKSCFGLGYDRYNKNESKTKSKFMSFVKATETEVKKPLKFGISEIKKNDDKDVENSDNERQTVGFGFKTNSNLSKIQSSFKSFVKGSDQLKGDEDIIKVNKKRKTFADDGEKEDKRAKKLKTNESKISTIKPSFVSFIQENSTAEHENAGDDCKTKKKKNKNKKNDIPDECKTEEKDNEIVENGLEKKKKKKREQVKSDETLETSNVNEDIPSKKGKKRKSESELDIAFTPVKKKFKNFEDLHTLQDEEKIVETPNKKSKKNKNDKKIKDANNENGLANPAFDPLYNEISIQKHNLDAIVEEPENLAVSPDDEVRKQKSEKGDTSLPSKSEKKKKKSKNIEGIDNPCVEDTSRLNESLESIGDSKKQKKKKSKNIEGIDNPCVEDISRLNESVESIGDSKKQKKKKSKKIVGIDNPCVEETSGFDLSLQSIDDSTVESKTQKKNKKKSKNTEGIDNPCAEDASRLDESTQSIHEINEESKKQKKKKLKNIEGSDKSCVEETSGLDVSLQSIDDSIAESKTQKKEKKKSKKEQKPLTNGIENSAFNENYQCNTEDNKFELKKKIKQEDKVPAVGDEENKKKKKNKKNKIVEEVEPSGSEQSVVEPTKKKKELLSVENPCFVSDDSLVSLEATPNKYEVKRSKKNGNLGIVNPGLDLTSPTPPNDKKEETLIEDMPIIDDNSLMLNVVCTPIIKKGDNAKLQRRKSVRFSDVNHSIIIDNTDSPANLRKNGGGAFDNAGYDQFGNRIEESLDTLNKQLDDYQAEVENDLNEAKMQVMVGEVGDPDGENELLPNGDCKLKFKYANFGRMPPWMKKKNVFTARSSYRHLIKGDIVLMFKNSNMHDIKGYNEHLKTTSTS
ncbi:interaptin-like [Harmonia axyridis]|uniref:interaptin-like n=1 Tax=Harmonia axyridis TaxID=115357 RepID=UPI001E275ADD|nr:interaptin-like [Harmonia axyridis]